MDMVKSLSILTAALVLGALPLQASAGEDDAFACELAENGCFSLDGGGYRLITKDMFGVKGKDCAYLYYIPEQERPPFATLMYTTDPGKTRELPLRIDRQEEDGSVISTCQGRASGVTAFTKRFLMKGNAVHIEIDYEATTPQSKAEYAIAFPMHLFKGAPYVASIDGKKELRGIVGDGQLERQTKGKPLNSLKISLKIGTLTMKSAGGFQWTASAQETEAEKACYLLLKPDAPKGAMTLDMSFEKAQ